MWSKRKSRGSSCFECDKNIEVGQEELVCYKKDENAPTGFKNFSINYCLDCGEELQRKEKEPELIRARKLVSEGLAEISQIRTKETNPSSYNIEDFKKIKNWKQKISELSKKELVGDSSFLEIEIKILQDSLQELEKFIPNRIVIADKFNSVNPIKGKSKIKPVKKTCSHDNILYEKEHPYCWYCGNCGEDNSEKFLKTLQKKILKIFIMSVENIKLIL